MNDQHGTTGQLVEELAELRQRFADSVVFRRLFQDSSVGTVVITPEGHFTRANQAFCDFIGYSESELVGRTVMSVTYPEDREASSKAIHQAVESATRIQRLEKRYLHKNGQALWAEVNSSFIFDEEGNPCYFIAQVLDIGNRKRVEEALFKAHNDLEQRVKERTAELQEANERLQREIEERRQTAKSLRQSHDELRAIYDGMVDGLLITDIETKRFIRANASICRMLGYSETELQSLSLKDIHPAEAISDILKNLPSGDEEAYQTPPGEIPFLRKDGSIFYVEVIGKFLIYDGRHCSMGIFRDITERKKAQEALDRERQSLWRMLQAGDRERQIISYDIHDGLAQYLAAAGMQFQVYESKKESSPDDAQKAYKTAVELVRQAHSESRRLISEVRHPVIDESGLESAIGNLVSVQQQREGPEIEYHYRVQFDRLPAILENTLFRIVQEALTNACKHSRSKKVTVAIMQEGRNVQLEVRDWGVGFEPEAIGAGHFGLEGIRERVRLFGGRLNVESMPGSGTLVQAVVPILENQPEG